MKQGWQIKDFETCIEKAKVTSKIPSSSYQEKGNYPIVSQEQELISGYWDNVDDVFKHTIPVIVFGDHTKIVKYIDFDFVIGADGVKILQPKAFLNPKFFYYWVMSVRIASHGYARHYRYLKENKVPVPPLSEQQRIVALLDAEFAKIDALKANAEKNLQNAKDLFQAALKKELEPKEGWETKKVDDVSILITKGASPKWQGIEYVKDNGILFITSENVREGYLLLSPMKYVESKFNQKQKRSVLKKNDVLVNIVGASIGRAAVFDMDIDNANINQAVALVRCNQEEILPKYLCLFLNSSIANDMYGLMKKDTARANLSLENISDITLPVPSLKDQDCLIDLLDELDDKCKLLQANYEKTLSLCDDLKQALLRKAFNGEL